MAAPKTTLNWDRSLVRPGDRICVAVSGGADSTALLLALLEANAEKTPLGIVVTAAHVHHGLRGPDADADELFLRDLCERLAVPLRVFHVDTAARQSSAREGLEEAARTLRYESLRSLLADNLADAIATAHTLDDQAETVLMKLLRGAWTEGLAAISPEIAATPQQPGRILRPLLAVRRSEIEAFLHARNQPWREDASNQDTTLTRNRVRHELMPALRSFNPCIDEALARTADIARDEESFWQGEVARLLPQLLLPGKPVRGGGRAVGTTVGEQSCAVELTRLTPMPAALRRRIVRALARSIGSRLTAEETAKVLALAGFGTVPGITGRIGSRLELREGLRIERSARELRFWRG
jgi:tRNA(Ile)-lysidine synthase